MLALLSTPEIHKANIHRAVKAGHVLLTELLIAKAGGDGNIKNGKGDTPLHFGSRNGHKEIVTILIQAGADVNEQNGIGFTPLHSASAYGRQEVVKKLIQAGGDVNKIDKWFGFTPLHFASQDGHVEVITALLAAGADKTIQNNGGYTPHDLADNQDCKNALG